MRMREGEIAFELPPEFIMKAHERMGLLYSHEVESTALIELLNEAAQAGILVGLEIKVLAVVGEEENTHDK